MNPAHVTHFPQLPGHGKQPEYNGTQFVTLSGTALRLRNIVLPQTRRIVAVPAGIARQNFPISHTGLDHSQFTLKLNGVTLYFKDRGGLPENALYEACRVLFHHYDSPKSVLLALKNSMKVERIRKNVTTDTTGISVHGRIYAGSPSVHYSIRASIKMLDGTKVVRSMAFNALNVRSVTKAFRVMRTLQDNVRKYGSITIADMDKMLKGMKDDTLPVTAYTIPESIMAQLKDNRKMRKSIAAGSGWTNPYTGEPM